MIVDFHVYPKQQCPASVPHDAIVFDPEDPQRKEIYAAVAKVMADAGRYREADECKHAGAL